MKKSDAINIIAGELNITLSRAKKVYEAIIRRIIEQLSKGNRVTLSGFGTFEIVTRRAKLGRNPRSGERLLIPQHLAVRFRMGKNLVRSMES